MILRASQWLINSQWLFLQLAWSLRSRPHNCIGMACWTGSWRQNTLLSYGLNRWRLRQSDKLQPLWNITIVVVFSWPHLLYSMSQRRGIFTAYLNERLFLTCCLSNEIKSDGRFRITQNWRVFRRLHWASRKWTLNPRSRFCDDIFLAWTLWYTFRNCSQIFTDCLIEPRWRNWVAADLITLINW